ncbi:MAG TPA: IS66 family transposase, partial [Planctomycetota bacterium]|nr:IS66 family transposase [Planctomycetota bacterium]
MLRELHRPKAEKVDPEEIERAFVAEFGPEDPDPVAAAPDAPDDEETPATKRERRKHPGRRKLPEHLERTTVEERPPAQGCCGEPMKDAGVEVFDQLDYVKAHFRVRRVLRRKLACAVRDHRVIRPGPPPDHPLERCGATVALLAKVVVEKYDRHVPLNRQCEEAARQDVPLSKATLCGWLSELAFVLAPIDREMRRRVAAGDRVNFDDTGIVVLDPSAPGGSRTAHVWAYLGGEGDAVFDYTPARSGAGPRAVLAGFREYAQCDAAGQHDGLFGEASGRREVGCMAHARRYFVKAAPTDGPIAAVALAFFRRLYAIEREAKDATPDARRALRRRRSAPLLRKFFAWAREKAKSALPKSPLGKAFGYLLRNQVALATYVKDGRLTIDNNAAERALRTVAVGRNNWQFAGGDEGG